MGNTTSHEVEKNGWKKEPCHMDMFTVKKLTCEQRNWIYGIYFIGILFWLFLIWYLNIKIGNVWDILIVSIPFVVFFLSMWFADSPLSPHNESMMIRNNYVNSAVIVIFPILIWATTKMEEEGAEGYDNFLLMVICSTIFGLLAFVDLWVGDDNYYIAKHVRTILHTFSLVLIIIALKQFYLDKINVTRGSGMFLEQACDA